MEISKGILDLQHYLDQFKAALKGKKEVHIRAFTDRIKVFHYVTCICEVTEKGEITLDNGGYETATTKRHLNTCLEVLKKEERIYQKGFKWYVNGLDSVEFTSQFKMTTY